MLIIYSEDQGLIENKIKELTKSKFSDYETFFYKTPNQIIDLLHANSMFDPKEKHYIIHECTFLSLESEAKMAFDLFRILEFNKDMDVFLTVNSPKLLTHEYVNNLFNFVKVIEIPKLNTRTFHNLVINSLRIKEINLSFDQTNILFSRIPQNALILNNEINKLSYHKSEELSDTLISDLVFEYNNLSIFKIIEYIFTNNIVSAINLLDFLVPQYYSYIEILQIMATQVLKLIMVSWALNQKISDNIISKSLSIGIYQLSQMKKICKTKSIKELETFLNSILSIDVKLKMFNTDPNCVRLFIAKGSC